MAERVEKPRISVKGLRGQMRTFSSGSHRARGRAGESTPDRAPAVAVRPVPRPCGANRVTADVQSFSNRGEQLFVRNRINGNLQCKQNTPPPRGWGNVVGGNKEDQCRRL
jgi:hypothetical protein